MRFEELVLERYGAFADRRIAFRADARLHVVLGRNEAGKTTALSAIGDLLFGFPHNTSYDFRHDARSLRIGARLRLRNGETLAFRRRKGRERTLVDGDDAALPNDLLAPHLGATTREIFTAEYGLTAQALRDGGQELARAGGRLSDALAASSAGMSALSHLRARLEAEADALFSPQRRVGSKPFYLACDAYQAAERQLRDALVTPDAWAEANAAVAQAQALAEALKARHENAGRDVARLQRVRRTAPKLRQIAAARTELAALGGAPDTSPEALARWRAALGEEAQFDARLAELDAAAAEDAARLAALHVDADLIAAGPAIDALRESIGAIDKAQSDLPRRLQAQRDAADRLDAAARSLGLADRRELLAQQPTEPALALAQSMISRGVGAQEQAQTARERLARAEAEMQRLAREDAALGACVDPEPLRRRLEAFADIPADCDLARREAEAFAAASAALDEDFARLTPRPATLDALARAPLPEAAQIAAAQRAFEQHSEARRDLAARRSACQQARDKAEARIASYAGAGAIITRARLVALRAERDAALEHLRAAPAQSSAIERLAALSREIDLVTDLLLSEGERAALLQEAQAQRDEAARAEASLTLAEEALTRKGAALAERWQALWRDSGLAPAEPAQMAAWLERASALLARRARRAERASANTALAAKLDALRAPLAALCADLRAACSPDMPLDLMYRGARQGVDAAQALWTETRARQAAREQASAALGDIQSDLARAEAAVAQWRAAWPKAADGLGLGGDAGIVEAEAALAVWRKAPEQIVEHERETRSVTGIQRDLDAFARDVAVLCVGSQADLAASDARPALDALSRRLAEARKAEVARRHLAEAAHARAEARAALETKRAAVRALLAQARQALRLEDEEPLESALAQAERGARRAAEIAAASADLAAEGLDEAALRAEADGVDADALDALIAEREAEQKQAMRDIEAAVAAASGAQARRDALERGRDADSALAARTEAGGEIVDVARRWLTRAAAARLAARAIERHRAAVQNPLIARASVLFARVTGGAFLGLRIDFDDKDRPTLAGARTDGSRVAIDHLSEGTRDQLFLALRLALLETRAAEPLPFVGDDLLASFDDARTGQTIDLLADGGQDQQIILFTHHAHVAEIARARPGVDVIEL